MNSCYVAKVVESEEIELLGRPGVAIGDEEERKDSNVRKIVN